MRNQKNNGKKGAAVAPSTTMTKRKQERKEKRSKKKSSQTKRHLSNNDEPPQRHDEHSSNETQSMIRKRKKVQDENNYSSLKNKKEKTKKQHRDRHHHDKDDDDNDIFGIQQEPHDNDEDDDDLYANMDDETAAALRMEDETIRHLEQKLGITSSSKKKQKLYREFTTEEGYDEHFGSFLDGLDNILTTGLGGSDGDDNSEDDSDDDRYDERYSGIAAPTLTKPRKDIKSRNNSKDKKSHGSDSEDDSDDDEELIPMKSPHRESSSSSEEEEKEGNENPHSDDNSSDDEEAPTLVHMKDDDDCDDKIEDDHSNESDDNNSYGSSNSDEDSSDSEEESTQSDEKDSDANENDEEENDEEDDDDDGGPRSKTKMLTIADGNTKDTYQPIKGQDIYGRTIDDLSQHSKKPTKYIPPHLRRRQEEENSENTKESQLVSATSNPQELSMIRRILNGLLNRLSDATVESISKEIMIKLFCSRTYIKADVCDIWFDKICQTCISSTQLFSSTPLIPLYASTVAVAHHADDDEGTSTSSIIVEKIVTHFLKTHEEARSSSLPSRGEAKDDEEQNASTTSSYSKESLNLILFLCYLYNFNVIYCGLMYDLIKDLIMSFKEVDIEGLLLILQHAGFQLRSDDPLALKEIVLLVQQRSIETLQTQEQQKEESSDNNVSRIRYMVSSIQDLKNNKKSKQDVVLMDQVKRYRKMIKSSASAAAAAATNDRQRQRHSHDTSASCSSSDPLRISLQDIRDIPTKGRWWKIGSSWKGNQFLGHHDQNSILNEGENLEAKKKARHSSKDDDEDPLLKLATKLGMNTDVRRSIFCIIMSSNDVEDAFEQLVKLCASNKATTERDIIRVLMECCLHEKTFNPYYALLASRLCEWSPKQCKFTFQKQYGSYFQQYFLQEEDDEDISRNKSKMKLRKVANLAKLYTHLLQQRHLSWMILKKLNVTSLREEGIIFMTIVLTQLFDSLTKDETRELFQSLTLSSSEASIELRENLAVFLLQYIQKSPKQQTSSKFHKNYKIALKLCQTETLQERQELF